MIRHSNGHEEFYIWSTRDEMAPPSDAARVRQRCCYTFAINLHCPRNCRASGGWERRKHVGQKPSRHAMDNESVSCVRSCVRSSNSTRGDGSGTGLRGRTSVGSHRSGRLCRQLSEDGSSGQATFVECTTMPSTVATCIVNFMPCFLKSDPTCHNCCAMVAGSCLMHITQSACQANDSAFY